MYIQKTMTFLDDHIVSPKNLSFERVISNLVSLHDKVFMYKV